MTRDLTSCNLWSHPSIEDVAQFCILISDRNNSAEQTEKQCRRIAWVSCIKKRKRHSTPLDDKPTPFRLQLLSNTSNTSWETDVVLNRQEPSLKKHSPAADQQPLESWCGNVLYRPTFRGRLFYSWGELWAKLRWFEELQVFGGESICLD